MYSFYIPTKIFMHKWWPVPDLSSGQSARDSTPHLSPASEQIAELVFLPHSQGIPEECRTARWQCVEKPMSTDTCRVMNSVQRSVYTTS